MVHWQLLILFTVFVTTICIFPPMKEENFKLCLHFTGAYDGDLKCANYCKTKGKTGGRCVRKRCVCRNNNEDEDENEDEDREHRRPKTGNQQSSLFARRKRMLYIKSIQ
ncbi:unnamed protein product [Rotaria sordida]|uniref:Invertebrate defensins family profile domain-containing protein n=1 Tax=Rotaria sordida TaxID=392033 RepID=A0A814JLE3_9BILA|nr:unnamed protein product [Rotaria sordida]CAF3765239.1 unnamed protein product [Rotaria sordida]